MSTTVVRDHLGNEYTSITKMCDAWKLSRRTFSKRIKDGWTVEEALTTALTIANPSCPCEDHLGNEYSSITKMCDAWKISRRTFSKRIKDGWTVEEALTTALENTKNGCPCKDHLGNEYSSITKMCNALEISRDVFSKRIKDGWTVEEALTTALKIANPSCLCKDHLGNEFNNKAEMCEAWGIRYSVFRDRISDGWTVEEALTTAIMNNGNHCKDHLGNEYISIVEMCRFWNIPPKTFRNRLSSGCDIETALTADKHSSFLEASVKEYLVSKGDIDFITEHTFYDCRFTDTNAPARFDFYIPSIGIIEIDGEQHFREVSIFDGYDGFIRNKEHDAIKTAYCEKKNIPLLRIRYDQMQDGLYKDMIDDFLANPANYIKNHNTYLCKEEYYAERTENLLAATA